MKVSMAVVLIVSGAAAGCVTRGMPEANTCFDAGRRGECTFLVTFDSEIEEFTTIKGISRSDSTKQSERELSGFDRYSAAVLTGDGIVVEVMKLPFSDVIIATHGSADVSPFPRPSVTGGASLAKIDLTSFAAPYIKKMGLHGGSSFDPARFVATPAVFAKEWTSLVRTPLAAGKLTEVRAALDSVTPSITATLINTANLIDSTQTQVLAGIESLSAAIVASRSSVNASCPDPTADSNACLTALHHASSLAVRQASLQQVIRNLVEALETPAAKSAGERVARLFDQAAVRFILGQNLDSEETLAGPAGLDIEPPKNPKAVTAKERQRLKEGLLRSGAVQEIDSNPALYLETRSSADLLTLRTNVLFAHENYGELRKYKAIRDELSGLGEATKRAIEVLTRFREDYEGRRVALASNVAALAFEFDRASATRMPKYRIPVYRTTKEEEVTLTLTRRPRFASPIAAGVLVTKDSSGKVVAANRVYTQKLLARSKSHFQITSGFAFSTIEASTFGTRDETESIVLPGDTAKTSVTHRYITETSGRPKKFVPAASLVFHPLGKDIHPDAYRTARVFIPGIAIGTTLDSPKNNFTLGVTFEPLPGLHLGVGSHWSQVQELQDGFERDDEISTGAVAPTRDKFARGEYFAGMVDLAVFAEFFGSLFK